MRNKKTEQGKTYTIDLDLATEYLIDAEFDENYRIYDVNVDEDDVNGEDILFVSAYNKYTDESVYVPHFITDLYIPDAVYVPIYTKDELRLKKLERITE